PTGPDSKVLPGRQIPEQGKAKRPRLSTGPFAYREVIDLILNRNLLFFPVLWGGRGAGSNTQIGK
ncbi:MAG TPA: hypothetical protein VGQ35_06660, partial [Dongiaceae bacterium]|nr:hypothetical protein [Dongiaceae bacterium]